jgi:hypothetical protein
MILTERFRFVEQGVKVRHATAARCIERANWG